MDFFTALATIRKEFPHLDESELRSAMDSEVEAEEKRLTSQRIRGKYARAVESAQFRITEWLKTGHEYGVDLNSVNSLAKFVASHRPAYVWAVLRSKERSKRCA
jgi:hypothetical protein